MSEQMHRVLEMASILGFFFLVVVISIDDLENIDHKSLEFFMVLPCLLSCIIKHGENVVHLNTIKIIKL